MALGETIGRIRDARGLSLSALARNEKNPTVPLACRIPAGSSSGELPPHRPGVEEYLVVNDGRLEARVGDEMVRLSRGDALYFEADVSHRFTNVGRGACGYYLVINSARAADRRPAARVGRSA